MCGIFGHSLVQDTDKRLMLTAAGGYGIDARGGDASGFLTVASGTVRYCKRVGEWSNAKMRFIRTAASGELVMMHARMATCGGKGFNEAHPYAIKRNGRVILWGAHNGMIYDADDSAKDHNRPYTVDSKELFELLADDEIKTINDLTGYGVITWVEANNPNAVKLCKLSEDGEIFVVSLKEGGIVWASTQKILYEALRIAKLTADLQYTIETGKIYSISNGEILYTGIDGLEVSSYSSRWSSYGGWNGLGNLSKYFDNSWEESDLLTKEEMEDMEMARLMREYAALKDNEAEGKVIDERLIEIDTSEFESLDSVEPREFDDDDYEEEKRLGYDGSTDFRSSKRNRMCVRNSNNRFLLRGT